MNKISSTILALVTTVMLFVSSCQSQPSMVDHEPPADFVIPDSLDTLIKESDLITVAKVMEAGPGRVVGDNNSTLQFIEAKLDIEELLKGAEQPGSLSVETEKTGSPYSYEWRKGGQRVLAFLALKSDLDNSRQYYRPVVPEAVFAINDQDVILTTADTDWEIFSEMQEMSLSEILAEIRRIVQGTP